MEFSRQEYWSGLPCPPAGDLPDSGVELVSLTSPALAGRFSTTNVTWEALYFKQLQENFKKQGKLKRIKELSWWIPTHSLFLSPNRANKDIGLVIHVDQITNSGWNLKGKEKNRTENTQVKMGWDVVGRIWKFENSGSGIRLPEFPNQSYCFLTMWT